MRKFGNEEIGIVSLFNFGKVLNFAKGRSTTGIEN